MNELRLSWEPESLVPVSQVERRLSEYMKGKRSGVSILRNGTLLFIKDGESDEANAKKAMEEAKFLTDFDVVELSEGGYLVAFHPAVAVFVGKEEFESVREEVASRIRDLEFPSEHFVGVNDEKFLIGIYARGKLQRDAHHFDFYKRIGTTTGTAGGIPPIA
jgi:hypothetical protein